MSWYRTAKLADKGATENEHIFSACSYCKRWLTQDESTKKWKKDNELSSEEKNEAAQAKINMVEGGLDYKGGISHGICSYCWPLLEKEDFRNIDYVVEQSLAMV